MSKAKELAEKAYPEGDTYIFGDASIACQVAYVKGYHQAEKDLELSWEDIKLLDKIFMNERIMSGLILGKEEYEKILKRYKDLKK